MTRTRIHRGWRIAALLAAVPLALAATIATAPAASANFIGRLDSVTPGSAPGTFDITWVAGGTGLNYWLAFAPASTGLTTCDYDAWDTYSDDVTPLGWLGSYEASVMLQETSLTTPPSVLNWFSNGDPYPIAPASMYLVCLFNEGTGQGDPMFSVSGGTIGSPPPEVLQQVGLPVAGTCDAVTDVSLNWGGVPSGGWTKSWSYWALATTGGQVCTRTLHFSVPLGKYVLAT